MNRLGAENRDGEAGAPANHLRRLDSVVLDEVGHLPFRVPAASCYSTSSPVCTAEPLWS